MAAIATTKEERLALVMGSPAFFLTAMFNGLNLAEDDFEVVHDIILWAEFKGGKRIPL